MTSAPSEFLAHYNAATGETHALETHLRDVGTLAAEFASAFGSADWGRVAGLWHYLGKYRHAFQEYLKRPDEKWEG